MFPSSVAAPVRLARVMVEPGSKSQLALMVTEIVLTTSARGVLCSTLTCITGTRTSSGFAPFVTPKISSVFLTIIVETTGDTSPNTDITLALTITDGDGWLVAGFVTLNLAS